MLLFEDKITSNKAQFISEVKRYSELLGINPNWLMAVMGYETILTFSPKITNTSSGAVGLIQFMPDSKTRTYIAEFPSVTVEKMKSLSNVEQLYYVYLHLKPYANKYKSFIDVYLGVFFPVAIGRSADWIFQWGSLSSSVIANQNPGFDLNKDKKVTIGEITTVMYNWLKKKQGFQIFQQYFQMK